MLGNRKRNEHFLFYQRCPCHQCEHHLLWGGKKVSEGFKFVFWTTAGVGWGSPHFEVIVIDV